MSDTLSPPGQGGPPRVSFWAPDPGARAEDTGTQVVSRADHRAYARLQVEELRGQALEERGRAPRGGPQGEHHGADRPPRTAKPRQDGILRERREGRGAAARPQHRVFRGPGRVRSQPSTAFPISSASVRRDV